MAQTNCFAVLNQKTDEVFLFISETSQIHTVTVESIGLGIEDVDFFQNIVNEKITKIKFL